MRGFENVIEKFPLAIVEGNEYKSAPLIHYTISILEAFSASC